MTCTSLPLGHAYADAAIAAAGTPTPTPSPLPTAVPLVVPTDTPVPFVLPTVTTVATVIPIATPIPAPTAIPLATEAISPTAIALPTLLPTITVAPTSAPATTATPVPTRTPSPTSPPSPTASPTSIIAIASVTPPSEPGSLDRTFGNNGVVATRITGQLTQLAPLTLGRGFYAFATSRACPSFIQPCVDTLTIAHFKADGSLDRRFGDGGLATLEGAFLGFTNVLVLPDGKFIVGVGALPQSRKPGLLRLNTDGQIDHTFGSDGQLATETVSKAMRRPVQPANLALQADGKILLTGSERYLDRPSIGGSAQQFIVARYTRAGQLDASFGRGGIIRHADLADVNADSFGTQLFVQPNGNIVTLGRVTNLNGFATLIYQFNSSGRQLFPSTTTKNMLYAQSPECQNTWLNMRMNADGKFSIFRTESGSACEQVYYRTNADLSLDTNVNVITKSVPSISAVEQSGKLIGVGQTQLSINELDIGTMAVFRYTERGRLDFEFGTGGAAQATILLGSIGSTRNTTPTLAPSAATLAAVQPDGMILVGGTYTVTEAGASNSYVALARFAGKPIATPIYTQYVPLLMTGR